MKNCDQPEIELCDLIDTHAHLNMSDFDIDRKETVARSFAKNVRMINVGTNLKSSEKAVKIAGTYPEGVFAAIGLHPINIDYGKFRIFSGNGIEKPENLLENDFDVRAYGALAEDRKVVAVGEIGLDFYYKPENLDHVEGYKSKQRDVFIKQLDFARQAGLPAIIHCRNAHDEMLGTLEEKTAAGKKMEGVVHCFNGSWPQAKRYLDMGFLIGVNGIIFKMKLDETLKKIPLEKMILETDCPFLLPPGRTGRNEPSFLPDIAKRLADIKGSDFRTVAGTTTKNAEKLFKLKN